MKRQISDYIKEHEKEISNAAFIVLSNPDIVGVMLSNHPVSLLRLISTTKVMSDMLDNIPLFFINFLDAMLIKETNNPYYAFYVTMYHEQRSLYKKILNLAKAYAGGLLNYSSFFVSHFFGTDVDEQDGTYYFTPKTARKLFVDDPRKTIFGKADDILTPKQASGDPNTNWVAMSDAARFYRNNINPMIIPYLTEKDRLLLCRFITHVTPYSMSDFYILDSRRLHYVRCCAQFRYDIIQNLQKTGFLFHNYVYISTTMKLLKSSRSPDFNLYDLSQNNPKNMRLILDKLNMIIFDEYDPLDNIRNGIMNLRENLTTKIDFTATEALLQLEVPKPYQFLDINYYKNLLAVYYHTNKLEKELLLGELRFIEAKHEKTEKYVETTYSNIIRK